MKFFKFFIIFLLFNSFTFATLEIKIPRTSDSIKRDVYYLDLLKFILDKSEIDYKITMVPMLYNQKRIIQELSKESNLINLYWMGTSKDFEEKMEPIRFPLLKGLLGYRIFIINKYKEEIFYDIKNLSDLQKLLGVQGVGWSDIEILNNSGLEQYELAYDRIFAFINNNRADYFSRGISEAFLEVKESKEEFQNLKVEEKILLVYPFAMLYFTNKNNYALRDAIEKGLTKTFEDGSFDEFFYNYPTIKEMFKKGNIDSRIRFDIPNPLMSNNTAGILNKYGIKR